MDNIFEIRELELCRLAVQKAHTAFSHHELNAGDECGDQSLPFNFMLFVLDGEISVCCNQFAGRRFKSDEMIFMSRSSAVRVTAVEKTRLVVFYFDICLSPCERRLFAAFLPDVGKTTYDFSPVSVSAPLRAFLDQMIYFQSLKVDCLVFNEVKHRELFVLISMLCSRDEIIALFAPLISVSYDFRAKVLDKYSVLMTGRVSELANLVGMGRKTFDKHFNAEFGTSPARWMQQETAKKVKLFLSEPGVTIADAMDKFHFNSPSHFNRFSRKNFGKSPGEIIKEAKTMNLAVL